MREISGDSGLWIADSRVFRNSWVNAALWTAGMRAAPRSDPSRMRHHVDHARRSLLGLAERQGGVVTYAQALAAGLTRAEISTLLRRGHAEAPRVGVLALAPSPQVGDLDPGRSRIVAAALLKHPDGVASHETAARVWQLPLIGGGVRAPETLSRPGTRPRTPAAASHGRVLTSTLFPGHVVRREHWLPVTAPARTVADIARNRGVEDGLVAADAAAHAGLLDRERFAAVLDDCRDFPAIGRALQVLDHLDPAAESPLETLSRWRLRAHGLEPETQVEIYAPDGHFVGRFDFLLDGCVIGESDGRGKYAGPDDLWAEKRREDDARRLGFGFVRWGWDDMWLAAHAVASRMRSELARGPRIEDGVRMVRRQPLRTLG